MLVTLIGIVILFRFILEQLWNADVPMLVTLFPIVALVKAVHDWNALVSMVRTLFPIVALVKPEQPWNAD
jgi:hypothetical protein